MIDIPGSAAGFPRRGRGIVWKVLVQIFSLFWTCLDYVFWNARITRYMANIGAFPAYGRDRTGVIPNSDG